MMKRDNHCADDEQGRCDGEAKFDGREFCVVRSGGAKVGKAEARREDGKQDEAPEGEAGESAEAERRRQPAPYAPPSSPAGAPARHTCPQRGHPCPGSIAGNHAGPVNTENQNPRRLPGESQLACSVARTHLRICA